MKRSYAIISSCVLLCLARSVLGQAGGGEGTGPDFGASVGCTPAFSFTLRQQWTSDNTPYYLYDAQLTNIGFVGDASSQDQNSYPLESITDIQLTLNGTGALSQYWNIDINNDNGVVPGYLYFNLPAGNEIAVGQSYSFGFIISGAAATALTGANPIQRSCDKPATSTTTSTAATSTSGSASSCAASIEITQTLVNSWPSGSQWTVSVANSGAASLSSIDLTATASNIAQIWEVSNPSAGHYGFPSYMNSLASSASWSFGYVSTSTAQVDFAIAAC